jgi:hypothetical protein
MLVFISSSIFKLLIGIVLLQAATGMLVVVALRTDNAEVWLLLVLLALTLGLLTAFWFASIITHARKEASAQIREGFSREREKIRIRAEREKTKVMEKSHQRLIKERSRSQAKSNTLSTGLLAGALALGGILVFTQFFTFGLLLITTASGAIGGYLLRSRQAVLSRKHKQSLESKQAQKPVERISGDW